MNKRLYTGFSFYQFVWTLILRLVCAFTLFCSLLHFDENPVVILIVSMICLLFIFIIGDDQIIIHQDSITQSTNSLVSLIFKQKKKSYYINQIKSAHLQTISKTSRFEFGAVVLLALILPRHNADTDKTEPIFFELKSGETVKFDTNLEIKKMEKIVEIINSLTKANCH